MRRERNAKQKASDDRLLDRPWKVDILFLRFAFRCTHSIHTRSYIVAIYEGIRACINSARYSLCVCAVWTQTLVSKPHLDRKPMARLFYYIILMEPTTSWLQSWSEFSNVRRFWYCLRSYVRRDTGGHSMSRPANTLSRDARNRSAFSEIVTKCVFLAASLSLLIVKSIQHRSAYQDGVTEKQIELTIEPCIRAAQWVIPNEPENRSKNA